MNTAVIIQALEILINDGPKAISLYQQVHDLLSASDEPGAKEALAKLEGSYGESAAAADKAIADAEATTSA